MQKRKEPKAQNSAQHKRKEPEASRQTVPGYEFAPKKKGLLPWKWASDRLKKSRQYWIATTRPDGAPHLMIIWGVWFEDSFWFSTGSASRKARNLAENPRCSIGTDNAAEAVILEGAVEAVDPQHAELEQFAKAYQNKYAWDVREMTQPSVRAPSNGGSYADRGSLRSGRGGGAGLRRHPLAISSIVRIAGLAT